jgi:alkaline phosphatase D
MATADVTLIVSDDYIQNRTMNHPHTKRDIFRIAFGSCHKRKWALYHRQQQQQQQQQSKAITIWDIIQGNHPDIFLWVGDTVYPPNYGIASLEELEYEYHQLALNETYGYSTFRTTMLGTYGTWDDHDYGANDAGKELLEKSERRRLFWEFLNYPKELQSKLSSREGLYHSIDIVLPNGNNNNHNHNQNHNHKNTIKILVLDTRWNRDYNCIPSVVTKVPYLGTAISCVLRWIVAGTQSWSYPWLCSSSSSSWSTILGTEQWEWLSQQLETSTAQFHILVSSIQVLSTNRAMEGWGHFPHEQERLLRLLQTTYRPNNHNPPKGGIIFLSGDVHHAELIHPPPGIPFLYEITSSGLTHTCTMSFYGSLCEPLLKRFSSHRQQPSTRNQDDTTTSTTANNNDNNHHHYYLDRNFGILDMNWESQEWNVNIQDANGNIVLSTGWKSWYTNPKETFWPTLHDLGHVIPKTTSDDLVPHVLGVAMALLFFLLVFMVWLVKRLVIFYLKPKRVRSWTMAKMNNSQLPDQEQKSKHD